MHDSCELKLRLVLEIKFCHSLFFFFTFFSLLLSFLLDGHIFVFQVMYDSHF